MAALLVHLVNTLDLELQDAHLALPGNSKEVLRIPVRFAPPTPLAAQEQ